MPIIVEDVEVTEEEDSEAQGPKPTPELL